MSARDAVVVTGVAGNLGRAVAKALHRLRPVIGVDRRPFPGRPKDVEHVQVDLRKRKAEEVFRRPEVGAIVHLGIMHDPRMSETDHHSFNVLGTTRVLECAVRYGVKKVVLLSSASVYGPSPDNSSFLTEDAPLMAASRFPSMRDLIEVDMLGAGFLWRHPEIETVLLRPVHIVGPTIRNAPSNYLRAERPWVLAGFDPMVQLLHMEDAAGALVEALRPGCRGVFNVVGPGQAPLSRVLQELGRRPRQVPSAVARPLLGGLFRGRMAEYPPEELDHIQYLCMVDGSRWTAETAWAPRYTLRETIQSVVSEWL